MRRFALLLLVAAVATTACPNGKSDKEKAAARKAQEQLAARLLAPTELPSVYSTVRVAPRQNKGRCGFSGDVETKDRIATADAGFQSADTQAQLQETLSRYKAGKADAVMDAVRKLPTDCASVTEKQGDQEVTLKTTTLDFPKLLDETVALTVSGTAGTTELNFEQVFMRLGDTLVVLVHGGLVKVDTKLTETLARAAAKKLAEGPTASTIPATTSTLAS